MASVQVNVPDFVTKAANLVVTMANDPHTHNAAAIALQVVKGKYPQFAGVLDSGTVFFVAMALAIANKPTPTETKPNA